MKENKQEPYTRPVRTVLWEEWGKVTGDGLFSGTGICLGDVNGSSVQVDVFFTVREVFHPADGDFQTADHEGINVLILILGRFLKNSGDLLRGEIDYTPEFSLSRLMVNSNAIMIILCFSWELYVPLVDKQIVSSVKSDIMIIIITRVFASYYSNELKGSNINGRL